MMLNFREIQLSDRPLIQGNLYDAKMHGAEYSFANLLFWGDQKVYIWGEIPLFYSRFGTWQSYLYPQCDNVREAVELLRGDAHERGIPLRLFGLLPEDAQELRDLFPGQFKFTIARDSFDYIYEIERLTELRGKKLQAKRNHCNRFEAAYPDYRVLPLTGELLPRCMEFVEYWYSTHTEEDYSAEQIALDRAFSNFGALGMEGIVIEAAGEIVAFSMGNRIRPDVFDVNFEKARPDINGAYPMVNREFARRIRATYPEIRFLNREDDMGIEGLRRAKESYFPDILLEKLVAQEVVK